MRKNKLLIIAPLAVAAAAMTACGVKPDAGTEASAMAESNADTGSSIGNEEYVYAKINVPYADYYYGEINNIEPEADPASLSVNLEAKDAAESMREAGSYDAVSSATKEKRANFLGAYSEEDGEGSSILGVSDVNVAISKSLLEDAKKALKDGKKSGNPLLDFVGMMAETTEEAPKEYKVLNSDGVLSKTVGSTEVAADAKADITTTSSYGHYQIDISDLELDIDTVQGVLLETDDGSKYGLEHLENIWQKPVELSFAVAPYTESHGNALDYVRYMDMPGKTIKKITYLLSDTDDIEIDTSLFVKLQAPQDYTLTGDEEVLYGAEGTNVNYTLYGADTQYALSRVIYRREDIDMANVSTDESGVLALPKEYVPGKYKFVFSNDQYSDMSFETLIKSGLPEGSITFEGNMIKVKENEQGITASTYLASIISAKVNDTEYKGGKGRKFGKTAFNEDGSINLEAAYKSDDGETPVFETAGTYTVTLQADGYPDVTFEVTK